MNNNFYKSVLIIGMGLIGSSIARVIKEKKIAERIFAIDKDKSIINKSKNLHLVDEIYENLQGISNNYYENRRMRIKKINSRSEFNHFVFHISNPIFASVRDLAIKYLSKNKIFLNNYLRKIYNNK